MRLRLERKLKNCCRNCARRQDKEFDLGDFGKTVWYVCGRGYEYPKDGGGCPGFECASTEEGIRDELLRDIGDPAVCGAKEPKIAALLWVLKDDEVDGDGFMSRLKRMFWKK